MGRISIIQDEDCFVVNGIPDREATLQNNCLFLKNREVVQLVSNTSIKFLYEFQNNFLLQPKQEIEHIVYQYFFAA